MESKNDNQSTVETGHDPSLQQAWNRFVDYSHTLDDLKLILDSIRKGEDLQECREVMNRIWNESLHHDAPPETKKQIKATTNFFLFPAFISLLSIFLAF